LNQVRCGPCYDFVGAPDGALYETTPKGGADGNCGTKIGHRHSGALLGTAVSGRFDFNGTVLELML
jgi:hypothetical protein